MRVLALSVLLAACAEPPAPVAPPPPVAEPVPARPAPVTPRVPTADHGDHGDHADHGGTAHAHGSGHGGEVKVAGAYHVEGRFLRSGLMVWIADAAEAPIDLATASGTAVIKGPAGVTTVLLASMGDHLHAAMTLPEGTAADAVVTLAIGGKAVSVDFRTAAVGSLAEHDHTALHGGVVSMWGDHHVEYVASADAVRFYVTDAKRVPVKAAVSGTATVAGKAVPLTFDAATGALSAAVAPSGLVMLDAKVGDATFSLGFGR